jgi:hypothetical protein
MTDLVDLKEIKLSELKRKTAAELLSLAEELEVETASETRTDVCDFEKPCCSKR